MALTLQGGCLVKQPEPGQAPLSHSLIPDALSFSVFSLSIYIFSQQYLTFCLSLSLTHTHNWQQQRPDKRHPEQEKELAAS